MAMSLRAAAKRLGRRGGKANRRKNPPRARLAKRKKRKK